MPSRNRITLATALGLVALLGGCGGTEEEGDALVVQPDASKVQAGGGESAGGAAPAGGPETAGTGGAAAPAAATKAEGWGTLKGRVTFEGEPPAPKMLVEKGATNVTNADVCALEPIPSQKLVVDPESHGVRWAIVYIPKPTAVNPEAKSAALAEPVIFDQKGCMFEPHVLAVMQGNTVKVTSSDPVGHNVHAKLNFTNFNQGIQPNAEMDYKITNPDNRPGQVVCDIHNWMEAWWLTLNNPYFAVTNEKGEYEIKNVPAGTQKVVCWAEATHPNFVTGSGSGDPVTIKADDVTEQNFTIKSSQVK